MFVGDAPEREGKKRAFLSSLSLFYSSPFSFLSFSFLLFFLAGALDLAGREGYIRGDEGAKHPCHGSFSSFGHLGWIADTIGFVSCA